MTEREKIVAFSTKLQEYVTQSGKTQSRIAREMGISRSTFCRWCNGYTLPSWEQIKTIAKYFNIACVTIMERRIVHIPNGNNDVFDVFVSTNPNSKKVMELSEKIDTMNREQLEQLLHYADSMSIM